MKDKLLFDACNKMISGARKSIGIIPSGFMLDAHGMVDGGQILRQPLKYDICRANSTNIETTPSCSIRVVIHKGSYELVRCSNDPRDGYSSERFLSFIDLSRKLTNIQMGIAVAQSMSTDEEAKLLKVSESSGDFIRYHEISWKYQAMHEENLEKYLRMEAIMRLNLIIERLSLQ